MYVQNDRVLHQGFADTALDCHDRAKALGQADQSTDVEPGDHAWLARIDQGLRHGLKVVRRLNFVAHIVCYVRKHRANDGPASRSDDLQHVMDL